MPKSPFLNTVRMDMHQKGYALKTEKTYLHWIKRFILFHKKRHPQTMRSEEVRQILSILAKATTELIRRPPHATKQRTKGASITEAPFDWPELRS